MSAQLCSWGWTALAARVIILSLSMVEAYPGQAHVEICIQVPHGVDPPLT